MIFAIVLLENSTSLQLGLRDFAALGFETSELAGGSLMISGSQSLFESVFEARLQVDASTGTVSVEGGEDAQSLPTRNLPEAMQSYIATVAFQGPLDFGPVSF